MVLLHHPSRKYTKGSVYVPPNMLRAEEELRMYTRIGARPERASTQSEYVCLPVMSRLMLKPSLRLFLPDNCSVSQAKQIGVEVTLINS